MAADVYCPECLSVETSDGPRVRLCAQHAERDRLAAPFARNADQIGGRRRGIEGHAANIVRDRGHGRDDHPPVDGGICGNMVTEGNIRIFCAK